MSTPTFDESRGDVNQVAFEISREQAKASKAEIAPLTMPGTAEQAANEIEEVSVEGRPGDPHSGPGMLWTEVVAVFALVAVISAAMAVWVSWEVGAAALAMGMIVLLVNPVLWATAARAHEREEIVQRNVKHP